MTIHIIPYEKQALGLMSRSSYSGIAWSDEDKRRRGCSVANAVLTRSVIVNLQEGSHFVATNDVSTYSRRLVYQAWAYTII